MKQVSPRKNTGFRKLASLVFSAVYLQVNVAWAAQPAFPLMQAVHGLWAIVYGPQKASSKIFVFHSAEDEWLRQQEQLEHESELSKVNDGGDQIVDRSATPQRVTDLGDRVKDAVKSELNSIAGGKTADVISATLLPGSVGVYKVLLHLNPDLPTDPYSQLTIAQDIFVSNIVTLPIVNIAGQ